MRKININGEDWTTVDEISYAVHEARHSVEGWEHEDAARRAIDRFVKILFDDEIEDAKTEENRKRIIEVPGKFVVCRRIHTSSGNKMEYYESHYMWDEVPTPVFTESYETARKFSSEAEAQKCASECGEDWNVIDVGKAAISRSHKIKSLIEKILGDNDGNSEDKIEINVIIENKEQEDENDDAESET